MPAYIQAGSPLFDGTPTHWTIFPSTDDKPHQAARRTYPGSIVEVYECKDLWQVRAWIAATGPKAGRSELNY